MFIYVHFTISLNIDEIRAYIIILVPGPYCFFGLSLQLQ
jgi:hypothetical protein